MVKTKEVKIKKYELEVVTGLRVGSGREIVKIGGVDSPVMKTKEGLPYIPGSSIKGKLRYLATINKEEISKKLNLDLESYEVLVKYTFGENPPGQNNQGEEKNNEREIPVAVLFRDLFIKKYDEIVRSLESGELDYDKINELYYEVKPEIRIDYKTGKVADKGLRFVERVVPRTLFEGEIVIKLFDDINEKYKKIVDKVEDFINILFTLLEEDYLGSSGSRGYGKVKIHMN